MVSFLQIELASLSAAAVFETALLLALLERRNWARAPLPVVLLVFGTWLWHAASLGHLLLDSAAGSAGVLDLTCRLAMAAGLLLIPSAMLHGVARLGRSGLDCGVTPDPRYGAIYLPLVVLLPIEAALVRAPHAPFLESLEGWIAPYAVWLASVNLVAAVGMLRLKRDLPRAHADHFLRLVAGILAALAILQPFVLLVARFVWPELAPWLLLAVSLSPAMLAVLFAYFVLRFNVMRLVLERSILYGVLLAAGWLVHQILFAGLREQLHDRYRLDLEIVEAMVLAALVLAYPPARRRTAEALRYLLGSRVGRVRERLREISLELAGQVGRPTGETAAWFAGQLREGLEFQYVAIWLKQGSEPVHVVDGELTREAAAGLEPTSPLLAKLAAAKEPWATRKNAPSPEILDKLDETAASLLVLLSAEGLEGTLLVGRRSRNRNLSEEETSAVVLLAEQFSAALAAGRLLAERAEAERRAMQNERLTLLGLLASSIAHEVKNPLSSIRTIAAVLGETLGPASPHAEDLRLIVGEADRLTASVGQLLAVVRPPLSAGPVQAETVLDSTLTLVRFVARDRGVSLAAEIAEGLRPVQADEGALREIFLNLLTNSIDAAGERGSVEVDCRQQNGHVVASFRDNGPGLSAEVREQLFQPFHTTKPGGTGLGLFITRHRVRECGGEIACESGPERGTCFTVKLPCAAEA